MAYVKPYGSTKPAISTHPVFPAIVALWFAALFGFGSLVLPNILVERIISTAGIDSIIPTAAPPLGANARFAISGVAAVFGALLGFIIARRVASAQGSSRPARVVRNPARGARQVEQGVRRPISATEELGTTNLETPAASGQQPAMPGRRRSLAMAEDATPSTYLQEAPLPGANRHSEDTHPMMPSMEAVANRQAAERAGTYARLAEETAQREAALKQQNEEAAALDLAEFEQTVVPPAHQRAVPVENLLKGLKNPSPTVPQSPQTTAPADNRTHFERQDFAEALDAQDIGSLPMAAPAARPPREATRQAEAAAPRQEFVQPAAELARQEFVPVAEPAAQMAPHVASQSLPQEVSPSAGNEVQDFSRPSPMAQAVGAKDPLAPFRAPEIDSDFDEDEEDQLAAFGMPDFGKPVNQAPKAVDPAPEPVAFEPAPEAAIEPEEMEVATDEVAHEEPLAFFAPSQANKLETGVADPAEIEIDDIAIEDTISVPQAPAATPVAAQPEAEQEPLEELGIIALAERLGRSLGKEPKPMAPPPEIFVSVAETQGDPAPKFASPAAVQWAEPESESTLDDDSDEDLPFDLPGPGAQPPAPVIPEALRPIPLDLDDFEEHALDVEDAPLDFSFATPQERPPTPVQQMAADAPQPARHLDESDEEDEDDNYANEATAEGYSSLLAMKNPFRGPAEFVRIDMPEPEMGAPEPAVVFPGQVPNSGSTYGQGFAAKPFSAPESGANDEQDGTHRRFDKPQDAADMAAKPSQRPRADRDETDRALRSALATLQRMSGAA